MTSPSTFFGNFDVDADEGFVTVTGFNSLEERSKDSAAFSVSAEIIRRLVRVSSR